VQAVKQGQASRSKSEVEDEDGESPIEQSNLMKLFRE